MKQLTIILLGLMGIAYGQFSNTSSKTRFVNGISLGTKLDAAFNAADSNAFYWRADSVLRAKYKGTARTIAFTDNLSSYKLVADTFFTNGYTTRGRTKQVIDSLGAAKANIADTSKWNRAANFVALKNSNDSVGIGTTSPASKLEIVSSTTTADLRLGTTSTRNYLSLLAQPTIGVTRYSFNSAVNVFGFGSRTFNDYLIAGSAGDYHVWRGSLNKGRFSFYGSINPLQYNAASADTSNLAFVVSADTSSERERFTVYNNGTIQIKSYPNTRDDGSTGSALYVDANGNLRHGAVTGAGLPSQGGNAGKYLSTDGTTASWQTVSGGGSADSSVFSTRFYRNTGIDSVVNLLTLKQNASPYLQPFDSVSANNMAVNGAGVTAFNGGTVSYDAANDWVLVTGNPAGQGAHLGPDLTQGEQYVLEITFAAGTSAEAIVFSNWANQLDTIRTGQTIFRAGFTARAAGGFGNKVTIIPVTTGDFKITNYRIFKVQQQNILYATLADTVLKNIKAQTDISIGQNAFTGSVSGGQSIAIGRDSYVNRQDGVAIGRRAEATFSTIYDATANTNGQNIAIGGGAKAYSWRGVAVGDSAVAGSTSATAIGMGSVANRTHAVAIGRGATIPNLPDSIYGNSGAAVALGGDGALDFGLGNWWGNRFPTPVSGISIQNLTPVNLTSTFHGQDAYDYVDSTQINVAGGAVALAGGRGTGTGAGGNILFRTALSENLGGNIKNRLTTQGMFHGSTGNLLLGSTSNQAGRLQVTSLTEQARIMYDATKFLAITVNSSGGVTLASQAAITTSSNLIPTGAFGTNATFGNANMYVFSSSGISSGLTGTGLPFMGASGVNSRIIERGSTSSTLGANLVYAGHLIGSQAVTTASTGTHAMLTQFAVNPLGTVTSGGAAVTNTATMYVGGAGSGGTNNYSLFVESGNSLFGGNLTATQFRLSALNTAPSSATDTGTTGEIRIDANFIYVCTATNTWKRVAISTW